MSHDAMLEEHRRTFNGFVRLLTYSTAVAAVVLALMAIFLL